MSRKHLALLVTMLSVGLVTHIFAGATHQHLRTSGILTGTCFGGIYNSVGAYVNGLGSSAVDACAPSFNAFIPMPSNGALTNLSVSLTSSVSAFSGSGSAVATVMVNGNATGLTCTMTLGPGQTFSCSDTKDLVFVSEGDLVGVWASVEPIQYPNYNLVVSLDRKSPVDRQE